MKSVMDMLNDAAERDECGNQPKLDPEVVVHRLREVAKRYARPNPFKVGDLVTPYPESIIGGTGQPHLVITTRETDFDFQAGAYGTPGYGAHCDIQVLFMGRGSIGPGWFDSACFDFWRIS